MKRKHKTCLVLFGKDGTPCLKQELGRLLNILCSCGHFPCGLGIPCAPGEMFYCTWALGVSSLTVEPWGSFLDVQEEATVFFQDRNLKFLWLLMCEQRIQSKRDIKYQILFWPQSGNFCFTWRCVGERPHEPNLWYIPMNIQIGYLGIFPLLQFLPMQNNHS